MLRELAQGRLEPVEFTSIVSQLIFTLFDKVIELREEVDKLKQQSKAS